MGKREMSRVLRARPRRAVRAMMLQTERKSAGSVPPSRCGSVRYIAAPCVRAGALTADAVSASFFGLARRPILNQMLVTIKNHSARRAAVACARRRQLLKHEICEKK